MMQKKLPDDSLSAVRLNKYLAQRGIASRRKIDELIENRQVRVNDRPAELGMKIDPARDTITVGKKKLDPQPAQTELEYWLVNKPAGYVSTTQDENDRPTVVSLVQSRTRVFPVGRLDLDSEGLILLTNDGELTQRLTHPKHHVPKVYRVWVRGRVTDRVLASIRAGVRLKRMRVEPAEVMVLEQNSKGAILQLTIHQGMNRQIRRMMMALNLETVRLLRVSIGPLKLGELSDGEARPLTPAEIALLRKL